jgi:hypothetical protein
MARTSITACVAQCRHWLALAESLMARLDDSHTALAPRPGAKTAGWLVGHLVMSGDFARSLCGRAPICPTGWSKSFKPGSQPSGNAADYPPMRSLCETFRTVYADLCAAADGAGSDLLSAPNPYEPARTAFPTTGELLEYLLTGHIAYHLGQLVVWCEAVGLKRPERTHAPSAEPGTAPAPTSTEALTGL